MNPSSQHQPTLKFLSNRRPLPVEPELRDLPAIHAYGETHRGRVRGSNEDHFLVAQTDRTVRVEGSSFGLEQGVGWPISREAKIVMVADGIGGHGHGELASAVVIDALLDAITSGYAADLRAESFERCLKAAQDRLLAVLQRKALPLHPGTTLTMAYVEWPSMYVVHAGDSRCYLLRDGQIKQLTQDHTMAARLVEAGLSQDSGIGSNVLINAVGGGSSDLRVDFGRYELRPGDRVLLCSDGVHSELSDRQIAEIVADAASQVDATSNLVAAASSAGGHDNVTAVVMQVSGCSG